MQQSITQTPPQTDDPRCHVTNHKDAWLRVLPGLQALHAAHEDQDWSVDGVRRLLDAGEALLIVDDDDESGFAVVMLRESRYYRDELEIFVYLMWHQGGKAAKRFCQRFDQIARATGARQIRFYSRRRGMARLTTPEGYRPRAIEYVKEV
jgi:hypothetical protein